MFKNTVREQNAGVLFRDSASSALSGWQQQTVYACLLCMHLNAFVLSRLVLRHGINNYNKSYPLCSRCLSTKIIKILLSGSVHVHMCLYGETKRIAAVWFFNIACTWKYWKYLILYNLETPSSM